MININNISFKWHKDENNIRIIKKNKINGVLIHRWHTREFIDYHRGWVWWITFISTLLVIGILFIMYFDNLLLGILCIIAIFTYYTVHIQTPNILEISITNEGICIGDEFIEYEDIKDFGIIQKEDRKELYINLKTNESKIILLEKERIDYIKNLLSDHIEEREHQKEPFFYTILHLLKL